MYLKQHYSKLGHMLLLVVLCSVLSCKTAKKEFVEPVKDISGTWHVTKVMQNSKDITAYVDLTQFTIKFNKDQTYTINGQMPFIVLENGTWSFNDPRYPFAINFKPNSTNAVSSNLAFTIAGSGYQMGISFFNGCDTYQNTYQYTLNPVAAQ